MKAARPTTKQLFQQAVDTVRTRPLDPPDRKPAFTLPKVAAHSVAPEAGPIEGLPDDLWDTRDRLRNGETTVADVVSGADGRIRAHSAHYGAFEYVADVSADTADLDAEARAGQWRGPLHGLPISVKDVIDVGGMPTRGSSLALVPHLAPEDATAVARLRRSGAVMVGKVATHEFALGVTTPQAHNPWDRTRVPGGSSGGSAISIVTGMALGSLGTDTRASIRVPAATCGLVGYKPSLELIPTDHWLTLSWSLDHFAPMARSVRDVALMMDVLVDRPGAFTGVLPSKLVGRRIGYSEATLVDGDLEVIARFREALAAMERGGANVVRLDAPTADDYFLANAVGLAVSRAEAAHFHLEAGTDLDRCIPEVRDQLKEATELMATDYVRALRLRGQLREQLERAMDGIDVLAMPTCKVVAPPRPDADDYLLVLSENCIPWSLVDFPAISVPMGLAGTMPCGIQFVAAPGQDPLLVSTAYAYERVAPIPMEWSPQ